MNIRETPDICTVTTGARLHFGPLAWRPARGRNFGGWGVMIDQPQGVVRVRRGAAANTVSDPAEASRAEAALSAVAAHFATLAAAPPLHVDILNALPAHHGLGSGTQISLAIAKAAVTLAGAGDTPVEALASILGRGKRSAVGVYGFDRGGLIVDAGKKESEELGALAVRMPFPDEWRFLLVWPRASDGLAGEPEAQAFQTLKPYGHGLTESLSRLVLTEILPSVERCDFDAFSAALGEYGRRVGEAFRDLQGGVVHKDSLSLYDSLQRQGVTGVAQSSWGPTLAVVARSHQEAEDWAKNIATEFGSEVFESLIVSAKNDEARAIIGKDG